MVDRLENQSTAVETHNMNAANPQTSRVLVAMSGGVDSSVAAALLQHQGYQVIGMMMRLWNEPGAEADNRCCTPDAMAIARRVAAQLGIPFYVVDAKEVFYNSVVRAFIDGYAHGITPNPCLNCNSSVRWGFLLEHAFSLEADYLATGHYARLRRDDAGRIQLLCAHDASKDQSYVLHMLSQRQLQHALFPIGEYTKPEVRQLARDFGLPAAEREESQDLCFLGGQDYRQFLLRQEQPSHAPQMALPGPILDRGGKLLGTHQGLAFYTIGQRKGLGISSPIPQYVIAKDIRRNALIVGSQALLLASELTAGNVNWVSGEIPSAPIRATIKIRYKAPPVWGWITPLEADHVRVQFDTPVAAIAPGQAAVFFDGEVVLGGGIIQ